jgi:hypothetical protein
LPNLVQVVGKGTQEIRAGVQAFDLFGVVVGFDDLAVHPAGNVIVMVGVLAQLSG